MAVKSTLGVGQQSGVYYSDPNYKKTTVASTIAPKATPVNTLTTQQKNDYQQLATVKKNQQTLNGQTAAASSSVDNWNTTTNAIPQTTYNAEKKQEAINVVNKTPTIVDNGSDGSGGGNGSYYTQSVQQPVDSYNAILDTYKQQLAQQRDDYLSEIEARLAANKKAYEDQYGTIETQYATQRDRANQEYDAEVAKAQKLYDEQSALANQKYNTGVAEANKLYGDQEALANQKYNTGVAEANKLYGDQEALANQEYNSKVAEANKLYEDQEYLANQEYDAQRNQSEVNRYRTARALREALANRGQLDSGLGRQETLQANSAYNNALNAINMNKAKTLNDISSTRNTSLTNLGNTLSNALNNISSNRTQSLTALENTLSNALNNISSNRTQSLTSLGNTKNNALADINLNESKARDLIAQYLLQLEADAKKERASVQNNYSNSLLSLMANQL